MHHELFLALLGHAGDVFEARREGFFVRADVAFITKPQKTLLNRLLVLGHAFATLEAFVRKAEEFPSIYVRALAQSIDRLLQQYTDAIVELERKVLAAKAVFPLPQMVYELEAFTELLPELCKVVRKLEVAGAQRPSGCIAGAQLLDLLHRATSSGFPRIRNAMQELLFACNRILFKQILAWILYGELADPFNEFFVRRTGSISSSTSDTKDDRSAVVWHRQFILDLEAVPLAFFPLAVAESVVFIGKSMQILVHANEFALVDAHALVQTVAALADAPIFDALTLEQAIERVRLDVAARLHAEIVVKASFSAFFASYLKGFFLLARGELFQALIERSDALMAAKPTHKSQNELTTGVWHSVLRDFLPPNDADAALQLFSLQLPLQTFAFRTFATIDGLELLGGVERDAATKSLVVRGSSDSSSSNEEAKEEQTSGAVWWKHKQLDASAFSSDVVLDLLDDDAINSTTRRFAFLFQNDSAFVVPSTSDNKFCLWNDQHSLLYASVAIECAIEWIGAGSECVAVTAHVHTTQSSSSSRSRIDTDDDDDNTNNTRASPRVVVPVTAKRLRVTLQYARLEVSTTVKQQLSYKKVLQIVINSIVVLEVPFDVPQALALPSTNYEYYIGLVLTRGVQLIEWTLDKFTSKAHWTPGTKLLKEQNEPLPPRELWRFVRLECDVQWPLQLLVTSETKRSYVLLFQFCFRLKRIAFALERLWKSFALRSHDVTSSSAKRAAALASALRSRMSFVVRNVALYFQVTVIESSYSKCAQEIANADDFDRVKRLHDAFVASLVKRCYLHTRTVASALDEVLASCWRLVEYVRHQDLSTTPLSFDRIAVLDQEFQSRFDFFYGVLQHSDARDLIFMLDYNAFFSNERDLRKQQRVGVLAGSSGSSGLGGGSSMMDAPTFSSSAFAQRFLSVCQQLDALQPVSIPTPSSSSSLAHQRSVSEHAATAPPPLTLPSRDRMFHIFANSERFRPCEEVCAASSSSKETSSLVGAAACASASAPSPIPRTRLAPSAPLSPASTTTAAPPGARKPCKPTAGIATDMPESRKDIKTPASAPVHVPVGGRARILPSHSLQRAKVALRKRSTALANLQPTLSGGLAPDKRRALHCAPESTWEVLRQASNTHAHSSSSTAHSALVSTGRTSSSLLLSHQPNFAALGKQALIAELVHRTHFSTQSIFQLSRKFKLMAGASKSVISFDEFRQIMNDDVGDLLLSVGATGAAADADSDSDSDVPAAPAAPSTTPSNMTAIGATISSSETFLRRLFLAFDADGDSKIDFREFVVGLNGFATGSLDEKVHALFEIYKSDVIGTEATVAISDLLGLFQGDRQLYHELMRCVDEYFARVELRDELQPTMKEDEFVTTSVAEPHLLDMVSRPMPSRRYASEAHVRDKLRAFLETKKLDWSKLLRIHRRMLEHTRSLVGSSGRGNNSRRRSTQRQLDSTSDELLASPPATPATPESRADVTDVGSYQALAMPAAAFHAILAECLGDPSTTTATESMPEDEALTQSILLAYVATPRENIATPASPLTAPVVGQAAPPDTLEPANRPKPPRRGSIMEHYVTHVACGELSQDIAVALQTARTSEHDADAKARYYFELYDQDGDGLLSRNELCTAICAGFGHFGQNVMDVVRILEDEDSDQDGHVTKDEYIRAATKSSLILASLYTV